MPNDDTDKLVSQAKEALGKARTKFPSPAAVPNAPAAKPVATTLPNPKPSPSLGEELNVKAKNVAEYDKAIPKMHDGGKVDSKVLGDKKEGPVILEKGEKVIPKKDAKMKDKVKEPKGAALMRGEEKSEPKSEKKAEKKEGEAKAEKKEAKNGKKGGKHKHTHIEHLDDGSHVVRHTPREGGQEVNYSAADMGGLHAGLDSNLGGDVAETTAPAAGAAMMSGAAPAKA